MNLFLSNFTETSLSYYCEGVFDVNHASPAAMVEFAASHIWFNQNRKVEWGDYANGNNVRLATKYINPVLRKYFGVTVDDIRVRYLDLDGDYLYWQETGRPRAGWLCVCNECGIPGKRLVSRVF